MSEYLYVSDYLIKFFDWILPKQSNNGIIGIQLSDLTKVHTP